MKKKVPRFLVFICQLMFLVLILLFSSCKEKPTEETNNTPLQETKIEFKQSLFNFGDISAGEIVTHSFYFKNIGEHNFVIKNIETTCGCTVVNYDKAPVKPGGEGRIEIEFNSSGRYGKQYKEISIFANIPGKVVTLKIIANIKN